MLILGGVGLALTVFVGVSALSVYRTYNEVRGPLQQAVSTLTSLAHDPNELNTIAGRSATRAQLRTAVSEIRLAQAQLDGSFGLKVLGNLPGLHTQRVGLHQLVEDLLSATKGADSLLTSIDKLADDSHGLDVSIPDLRGLSTSMSDTQNSLVNLIRPASGLWGPLGADRQKFDQENDRAIKLLGQGIDLTDYAIPFLGGEGTRTYLLMGENNAEMRDQGSPLSYATMTADLGHLSIVDGGSIGPLERNLPQPSITLPLGTQEAFGALLPTQLWENTDATADFPLSGQAMATLYQKATGRSVDGVIGLDVPTLQSFLAISGPVTVAGIPEAVTSENAASVLLHQLYEGMAPNTPQSSRHEELSAVASAAVDRLTASKVDLVSLARNVSTDVSGRHLLIWDANPSLEELVRDIGASGAIDTDDPSRTFHIAVENATATKLDYYVTVAIADQITIHRDGSATVSTTVALQNHVPPGQPPSLQIGPDDVNSHIPGQYVGRVFLWAPAGSNQPNSVVESGLELNHEVDLSLLPGTSAAAHFTTTIPDALQNGVLHLVFVPQPRLRPEALTINIRDPYASLETRSWQGSISKTLGLNWHF